MESERHLYYNRLRRYIMFNEIKGNPLKKETRMGGKDAIQAWKVFTVVDSNKLKFLYHGINKDRNIQFDKWLKADVKQVRDGTGKRYYKSGFHVFLTFELALKWLAAATKDEKRTICPVSIKNWDYKKSAKYKDTVLAEYLYIDL